MMGDYHVRFRERFRGETPLYLLDRLAARHLVTIMLRGTFPDDDKRSTKYE